ncbi:hypothetical protein [Actinacidiphila glaucinigra]|uniref:hypothetical protein n=1 Tax=Actinacidiphila glaucinigra TaxID=235986 RepID=UPI0037153DBA
MNEAVDHRGATAPPPKTSPPAAEDLIAGHDHRRVFVAAGSAGTVVGRRTRLGESGIDEALTCGH